MSQNVFYFIWENKYDCFEKISLIDVVLKFHNNLFESCFYLIINVWQIIVFQSSTFPHLYTKWTFRHKVLFVKTGNTRQKHENNLLWYAPAPRRGIARFINCIPDNQWKIMVQTSGSQRGVHRLREGIYGGRGSCKVFKLCNTRKMCRFFFCI